MVIEIMCGDGLWHIDQCPPTSVVQRFALQKNTNVKCTWKINTHKTTSRPLAPCYFGFWAQFQYGAFEHHKHWFYLDDLSYYVGGIHESMLLLGYMSRLYGLFSMVSTLLKKRYHIWKRLGFCLTLNTRTTLEVYLNWAFHFKQFPGSFNLYIKCNQTCICKQLAHILF
jgi:hypothetical protein